MSPPINSLYGVLELSRVEGWGLRSDLSEVLFRESSLVPVGCLCPTYYS